ncbi:MAG: hypothetical protein ACLS28_15065 [Clostridium neonatale]
MIFNTNNQLTSLNELYVGEAKEDYVSEAIMAATLALIIRGGMEVFSGDSAEVGEIAGEGTSAKVLIGRYVEDYLTKNIGGDGSFSVGGREFDGGIGNRWWEAKSGGYWNLLESDANKLAKFKSDMGDRLRIAKENEATYELFFNIPIPDLIKSWLVKKRNKLYRVT